MAGKDTKKITNKGVKKNGRNAAGQKPKTYSGVVKSPSTRKVTGRVFLREDEHNTGIRYGTIVILAALAAMAATFSSIGNATIDYYGLNGISASGIWIMFAAVAGIAGFILAIMDKESKGKY